MIAFSDIQNLADRIATAFHPQKILLFGSYAYGSPAEGSDVDLMVIMPLEVPWVTKAVEIELAIHPTFAIDLLVRTPERVQERLAMGDRFMKKVLHEGKVLYEA